MTSSNLRIILSRHPISHTKHKTAVKHKHITNPSINQTTEQPFIQTKNSNNNNTHKTHIQMLSRPRFLSFSLSFPPLRLLLPRLLLPVALPPLLAPLLWPTVLGKRKAEKWEILSESWLELVNRRGGDRKLQKLPQNFENGRVTAKSYFSNWKYRKVKRPQKSTIECY